MKLCILGDDHGRGKWKALVEKHKDCNLFIFLGDYTDPYDLTTDKQIIDNLKEIIKFKNKNKDNVLLLLGNHDLHYFDSRMPISTRYNSNISNELKKLFINNIKLFERAWQINNYLFTHAGITEEWFNDDLKGDKFKNIAIQINESKKNCLFNISYYRGGSDKNSGPFWTDANELIKSPLKDYIQIVGHTQFKELAIYPNEDNPQIYFCDCLGWKEECLILEIK